MPRPFRRLAHALRRGLAGTPPIDVVVGAEEQLPLPGNVLDPWRVPRLLGFLEREGLVVAGKLARPATAGLADLRRIHDLAYLEALERPGATEKAFGARLPDRIEQRALAFHRSQVGATLLATRMALERQGLVLHLGGGFHHARRDRGAGFCLFNDIAVAIADARARGFDGPIAVLDLDLHDGDGTRSIFAADTSVHTLSIHNRPWDDEPAIESTSIALGSGVDDGRYLETVRAEVIPLLDRFRPRLVFYLAGVDPAEDDVLGDWRISDAGLVERDRRVFDALIERRIPTVVLLAGGYGEDAWRHSARSFARLLSGGRAIEPPSTADALVARFRHLAGALDAGELGGYGDDLLTEADVSEALGAATVHRFLGFYTRAGVELALERLGYLDQLRALGFDEPRVELETSGAGGDTIRVFGGADRRELLVELRARRDRRVLAGFELLWIEWLLLQNPRVPFTADRPALPGQAHPGLGLLRETMAAMVLVCDRLQLDGIGVTASHFHPAAQSLATMHLLDPDDERLFRALGAAVSGLPHAAACKAIEQQGLEDAATGEPFVWRPLSMVYPVSPRLHAHFESAAYTARAGASGPVLRQRRNLTGPT